MLELHKAPSARTPQDKERVKRGMDLSPVQSNLIALLKAMEP